MNNVNAVKEAIGIRIASFINEPIKGYEPLVSGLGQVHLLPADVILVSPLHEDDQ